MSLLEFAIFLFIIQIPAVSPTSHIPSSLRSSHLLFLHLLPVSVFCLLIFVNYHNTLLIKFMFACLDRKVPRFFNHIIFYLEDNPVQFWEDPNLMPSRYSYRQCQKLGKAENAVSVCTLHPITKFLRFLRLFLRYFCAISTLDSV